MPQPQLKALYDRQGGEKWLQEILEDFYQSMSQDILIGFFFQGKDLIKIASHQKEFLMHAMGVNTTYSGKPPTQAHNQLPPILAGHFDRRIAILRETLADHGLNDSDAQVWIDFELAFRKAILDHQPKQDA